MFAAVPDITKYTYDKNSGYQYDPTTGLYYDPNSNYYWNSVIQKYLYWDQEKLTYVLAPTTYECYATAQQTPTTPQEPETKKHKSEKQDKVKVAKKIAKDMERWAKNLNQKKELSNSRAHSDASATASGSATAAADIGFSVLEKKNGSVPIGGATVAVAAAAAASVPLFRNEVQHDDQNSTPLVAEYGGETESSGDEEVGDDADYLDFTKLICNLCKRQFTSAETLTKHSKLSSLHKQNLEVKKGRKRSASEKVVYRDRAKERRMKYGDPDEPQPSKLKEKYLKSRELVENLPAATTSVMEPIGTENVGNKLLQKMGWTEGQGLGKSNQGRTTIIQVSYNFRKYMERQIGF